MTRPEGGVTNILIPVASFIDRERLAEALHVLTVFPSPILVLLRVVEIPSRTLPISAEASREEVEAAERELAPVAEWLKRQGFDARVRVAVARRVVDGIIEEANSGGYAAVVMLKRRIRGGLGRLFEKSVSEAVIRDVKCMVIVMLMERW